MLPGDKRDRQVFGGFDKTYKVFQNEAILSEEVDKEIAFKTLSSQRGVCIFSWLNCKTSLNFFSGLNYQSYKRTENLRGFFTGRANNNCVFTAHIDMAHIIEKMHH